MTRDGIPSSDIKPIAGKQHMRQMDLSAAATKGEAQYKWLKEKFKPRKKRKSREPETPSLF